MSFVYLIESNNPTVLSQAIGAFSHYPYNHLSISLDRSLTEVYSFGRMKPNNPLNGGFVQEDYTHPFYSHSKVRVYAIEVSDEQLDQLKQRITTFEEAADEWRYNFLGLFPAYVKVSWTRDHHYFCSQFVASLLKEADILSHDFNPNISHPKDVIEGIQPTLIYEGALWEYPTLAKLIPQGEYLKLSGGRLRRILRVHKKALSTYINK